jgi:hypothetical protein
VNPVQSVPSGTPDHRRQRLALLLGASLLLSQFAIQTVLTVPALGASDTGRYIVLLKDPPLAAYRGGIGRLAATEPSAIGQKRLNPGSSASKAYLAYLAQQQSTVKSAVDKAVGRNVKVAFRYTTVLNGMALSLSAAEAGRVATLATVARVVPDKNLTLLTDAGPTFIGAPSIWGGTGGGGATKGEGLVAGIIDSGINHDHPSFAAVGGDGYHHTNPKGRYFGICDPVTGAPLCNAKLIGVYDFTGTSPEDDNGHGSHTSSTVAGNSLDMALVAPTITVNRHISGVAPHANIIMYKACVTTPAAGICPQSGTVAGIEQATLDGVDVINFSIGGGPSDPWTDVNAIAFLNAQRAGVYSAVAAGNDGPTPGTVGSPADAPWVASAAASTHDRKFVNALINMSGGTTPPANMIGLAVTKGYGPATIVYAGAYGYPLCGDGPANDATGEAAINPFPAGTFHGEIVVCDRGTYGRVEKGQNVMEGGAGGYVLVNDAASGDSLVGDAYTLPGVHLTFNDGIVLKTWLATAGTHTASIKGQSIDIQPANGDVMASFSSRGPDTSVPTVLKPDISAPGVDILAAFATPATNPLGNNEYAIESGTSMASPHTAGAALLVRALHRDWTPDQVRSALMTTAVTSMRKEDAATTASPFDRGSGRVDLTRAGKAGLLFNEIADNYQAADPSLGGDPTTLNLASLAQPECAATCSWTRTVTGSASGTVTWTASVTAPAGMSLTVSPASFSLANGAARTITFTADVTGLPFAQYRFAEVRLTPSTTAIPAVHIPVALARVAGASETPPPDPRLVLHFQGNLDEGCSGEGIADLVICGGPFLNTNATLDANPPARWTTTSALDDAQAQSTIDPNWIWNLTAPTTLEGQMTVNFYGQCNLCAAGLLDGLWAIRLWADGVKVVDQEVDVAVSNAAVPELLTATVAVPRTTANQSFVIQVDPYYSDAEDPAVILYDSTTSCSLDTSAPCDSIVRMPVAGGATPTPTPTPSPTPAPADLQVSAMSASQQKPKAGDPVVISATVSNTGASAAAASKTEFKLGDGTVLGLVDTPAIGAGGNATVTVGWNTHGANGDYVVTATADKAATVAESNENNNLANLTVSIRGNKVQNQSYEQPNSSGTGPDAWQSGSTGAGSTSYDSGSSSASDGTHSVSISGNRKSAALYGVPTWTSASFSVTPGELLTVSVDVKSVGLSSAPSLSLAYLGPAGELLNTVKVIAAPLTTTGFSTLSSQLSVPLNVTSVRLVLAGFAPTDTRTAGTVTFDNVGVWSQ